MLHAIMYINNVIDTSPYCLLTVLPLSSPNPSTFVWHSARLTVRVMSSWVEIVIYFVKVNSCKDVGGPTSIFLTPAHNVWLWSSLFKKNTKSVFTLPYQVVNINSLHFHERHLTSYVVGHFKQAHRCQMVLYISTIF